MPTKSIIKHQSNTTPGIAPASGTVPSGTLALNTEDGKLFTANSTGGIVEIHGRVGGANTTLQFNDSSFANGVPALIYNKDHDALILNNIVLVNGMTGSAIKGNFDVLSNTTLASTEAIEARVNQETANRKLEIAANEGWLGVGDIASHAVFSVNNATNVANIFDRENTTAVGTMTVPSPGIDSNIVGSLDNTYETVRYSIEFTGTVTLAPLSETTRTNDRVELRIALGNYETGTLNDPQLPTFTDGTLTSYQVGSGSDGGAGGQASLNYSAIEYTFAQFANNGEKHIIEFVINQPTTGNKWKDIDVQILWVDGGGTFVTSSESISATIKVLADTPTEKFITERTTGLLSNPTISDNTLSFEVEGETERTTLEVGGGGGGADFSANVASATSELKIAVEETVHTSNPFSLVAASSGSGISLKIGYEDFFTPLGSLTPASSTIKGIVWYGPEAASTHVASRYQATVTTASLNGNGLEALEVNGVIVPMALQDESGGFSEFISVGTYSTGFTLGANAVNLLFTDGTLARSTVTVGDRTITHDVTTDWLGIETVKSDIAALETVDTELRGLIDAATDEPLSLTPNILRYANPVGDLGPGSEFIVTSPALNSADSAPDFTMSGNVINVTNGGVFFISLDIATRATIGGTENVASILRVTRNSANTNVELSHLDIRFAGENIGPSRSVELQANDNIRLIIVNEVTTGSAQFDLSRIIKVQLELNRLSGSAMPAESSGAGGTVGGVREARSRPIILSQRATTRPADPTITWSDSGAVGNYGNWILGPTPLAAGADPASNPMWLAYADVGSPAGSDVWSTPVWSIFQADGYPDFSTVEYAATNTTLVGSPTFIEGTHTYIRFLVFGNGWTEWIPFAPVIAEWNIVTNFAWNGAGPFNKPLATPANFSYFRDMEFRYSLLSPAWANVNGTQSFRWQPNFVPIVNRTSNDVYATGKNLSMRCYIDYQMGGDLSDSSLTTNAIGIAIGETKNAWNVVFIRDDVTSTERIVNRIQILNALGPITLWELWAR